MSNFKDILELIPESILIFRHDPNSNNDVTTFYQNKVMENFKNLYGTFLYNQ